MSTDFQKTPHAVPALEFKSSSFSVPVLVLSGNDLTAIDHQLQKKIQLAPEFFKNSPIVFDVQDLNKQDLDIDIAELTGILYKAGLLPIGIRGGNELQNNKALELLIPIYSQHHSVSTESLPKEKNKPETQKVPSAEPKTESSTTLITHPVRSGQRIYSTGDLIILAQVSAGAEILAEGNVHVYNTLRGRVLAGVLGNEEARIFCSDLQAELISIAGNYKVSEDLNESIRNKPVQVYLQEHTLIIKDIV
ncbi:MAG: septum site-determining protein MinC [Methylovulum sp.]|nr:septum site-determining protein MinC [Methylovulum sp.]